MGFSGGSGSSSIGGATDVTLSNPATGQVLTYNAATSKWQNLALPTARVITPEQHGAVGNGTTDDTAAISATIAAAGTGGVVYFAQSYLVTASLAPLAGQQWYGPGTLQIAASNTSPIIYVASSLSDVHIGPGLTFDGNRSNQVVSGLSLLYFVSPTNLIIENCTIQNSYAGMSYNGTPGLQLRMPQNCHVQNCYFNNVAYGIQLGSLSTDTTPMYGNSVTDCVFNTVDWDGLFLTENIGSGHVAASAVHGYLHGTVVANCSFQQVGDAAIEVGSGNVGTTIGNCTVDNALNPTLGNNGIIIRDSQDISVTGCTFRNYLKAASSAILMWNLNGTNAAGTGNSNITFSSCVVDTVDYGLWDQSGMIGLTISGCNFNKFSQTSNGSCGIVLGSTATFSITGTTLSNGSATPSSTEGMALVGVHDGTISGCNFYNNRGNDALIMASTCYNLTITGNRFGPSNVGHALRIYDSGSHDITMVGNDFSGNTTGNGISFSSTFGANLVARSNNGYNPVGVETVTVPSSGTAVPATTHDRTYYVTNGSAATTLAISSGPTITIPVSAFAPVLVPAGCTMTPTYTVTPSWVVEGE